VGIGDVRDRRQLADHALPRSELNTIQQPLARTDLELAVPVRVDPRRVQG
jgi:hypothetical protein